MTETMQGAPLLDWGVWANEDDLMPSQMFTNIAIALDNGDTSDAFQANYDAVVNSSAGVLDQVQSEMLADFLNAVSDALQAGELRYGDVAGFTFWLEYNMNQQSIANTSDMQTVMSQWIDQYALTHDLPVPEGRTVPGPQVQQTIEGINAAEGPPAPLLTPL